jgi:putative endonuclease
MEKSYRVYVLENANGKRYIGLSEDPQKRLAQHNAGFSEWTAKHGPWKISWLSRILSINEARKLENLMKRQKGGTGLNRLMSKLGSSSHARI